MSGWTHVRGRRPSRAFTQRSRPLNPQSMWKGEQRNQRGQTFSYFPHPQDGNNNFWQHGNRFAALRSLTDTSRSRSRSGFRNKQFITPRPEPRNNTNNTRRMGPEHTRRVTDNNIRTRYLPPRLDNRPRPNFPKRPGQTGSTITQQRLTGQNKKTVKDIHNMIRTVHHLNNIIDTDKQPPTIKKLTEYLGSVIKPACPTDKTALLIEGNAKNWAYTAQLILRQHYEDLIDTLSQEIQTSIPKDWGDLFETATRWAIRSLGRRLESETIEKTKAILVALAQEKEEASATGMTTCTRTHPMDSPILGMTEENFPPLIILQQKDRQGVTVATNTDNTTQTDIEPAQGQRDMFSDTLGGGEEVDPSLDTLVWEEGHSSRDTWGEREEDTPLLINLDTHLATRTPHPRRTLRIRNTNPNVFTDNMAELDKIIQLPVDTQETVTKRTKDRHTTSILNDIAPGPGLCVAQIHEPPRHNDKDLSDREGDNSPLPPRRRTPTPFWIEGQNIDTTPRSRREPSLSPLWIERRSTPITTQSRFSLTPLKPIISTFTHPIRHIKTRKKFLDWNLTVTQPIVILGDSNLSKVGKVQAPKLQMDSFPGATFAHATAVLQRAIVDTKVDLVILSFGINHRGQRSATTAIQQLQSTLKAAKSKFSTTNIFVPLINYSKKLKTSEMKVLRDLNNYLKSYSKHIPELPGFLFRTADDNVHWTPDTAEAMIQHWAQHLNQIAL